MNREDFKGDRRQFKGEVKEHWGGLTDGDLDVIEAKRDPLVGTIKKRCGIAIDEAERRAKELEAALG